VRAAQIVPVARSGRTWAGMKVLGELERSGIVELLASGACRSTSSFPCCRNRHVL
jgi:hypothetical protein